MQHVDGPAAGAVELRIKICPTQTTSTRAAAPRPPAGGGPHAHLDSR
jgi:hypothetical protein